MNLQKIYRELKPDLQVIEKRLTDSIKSNHPDLHKTSSHLLQAGGKRIRPIFVLLAGHFGSFDIQRVSQVANTLELIHMATLVHDDVIDDATLRRGELTVKAKWDNQVAMVTGDYLFGCALREISQIADPVIHQVLSTSMVEVCRGEIEQIRDLYQKQLSVKRYLHRIKRKTALLIAISCKLGGIICGANPQVVNKLYAYGYYLGMAFQMVDDVLDFTGSEKSLGKPAGSDLRQGNVTLPVIHTLLYGDSQQQQTIDTYLEHEGKTSDKEFKRVLALVKQADGIPYTIELAERYVHKALLALDGLPAIRQRTLMREIAEFVLQRSY